MVFLRGDVRTVDSCDVVPDAVIHASTAARASLNQQRPDEMLDVIERGAERTIALAQRAGTIPFLFTSSGAVYGRQPVEMSHIAETYGGAPDVMNPLNAYHEGKRVAELRGAIAAQSGLGFVSARLFAFLGPLLPLDEHFAAGNFIRDALAGHEIAVAGDGTAVRSYLYPTDLTVGLWALLATDGQATPTTLARSEPCRSPNWRNSAGVSAAGFRFESVDGQIHRLRSTVTCRVRQRFAPSSGLSKYRASRVRSRPHSGGGVINSRSGVIGNYRAVVFDLDGVLIDSSEGIRRSLDVALVDLGLRELADDELRDLIGPPLLAGVHCLLTGRGAPPDLTVPVVERFRASYQSISVQLTKLMPGVESMLTVLSRSHLELAIATSKPSASTVLLVAAVGNHSIHHNHRQSGRRSR